MPAYHIYDHAPLGALVRYSDGTPRPPARFTKKLAAWERRNGLGRLVQKTPPRQLASYVAPASITLHEGNFAARGVILVTVTHTYPVDSELRFEVVERPTVGSVRVVQPIGENIELLHLAESREAADLWLAKNPHRRARLEEVTADEVCADVVEGRAAA